MADITNLFKATIKAVKARQKSQGKQLPIDKSILGIPKKNTEFSSKAKDVVKHISKLKDFLLEHRKDYINASGYLNHENGKLTDGERDQIDADAEKIMKICHEAIKSFKTQVHHDKVLPQVKEHRDAVLDLITFYLKGVCKIYSEQRAIRVKRVVDKKRISRLEPEVKRPKESFVSRLEKYENTEKGRIEKQDASEEDSVQTSSKPASKPTQRVPLFSEDSDDDMELSVDEQQQLAIENNQLYQEMNSVVDEVKQIEGKVVEISRLQEIFGEKVLEQEKDISRIGDAAVGTSENIKDANEEIREAMKNNAGLRVWILFFLIVLSLSLLFLDWYNP